MYMNGRGPMNRGFGPGGPMHRRPAGFRPMGMRYRPMGLFPIGSLLILPTLMFGGWIVIAVVGGVLGVIGTVIGGIFTGLSSLASGISSEGGLALGIVIGLAAYSYFRKRNTAGKAEDE